MEKRFVYADNAATTRVSENALKAMLPFLQEGFGNPSSLYSVGRKAAAALLDARKKVAEALGADTKEIYFTSCGSEADNWAVRSAAFECAKKGKRHIITSAFEHHAVLRTCAFLEGQGFEVTYISPDSRGLIDPADVKRAVREDTGLVSVM